MKTWERGEYSALSSLIAGDFVMRNNVVFRPTVVIGLGGTGHGAVLKLKRRFIDVYGSVPPIIKFLAIDTTENVEQSERARDGSTITLEPNERYVLSVVNPGALVSGANDHIDEWWPQNIPIAAIVAGAGQVRARGRLALFAKSKEIFGRIYRAIDDVNAIKNAKQAHSEEFGISQRGGVEVYIVSSLAGGTGSGIFLDAAFIARSHLDSLSNITGVLVLPRIFSRLPGTHLVKPNAYGALKEIERWTKFSPGDNFKINYGTDEIDVNREPFQLLYLVDSMNEAGKVINDTGDLLGIVADGLYIQIGSQIGIDSENAVDNIKTALSTAPRIHDRSRSYCSFGVASLTLPVRQYEVMKIDSARQLLSDGLLSGVFPDTELENEVVRFIQDNHIREDDADDVIDALNEREGGGQMRFPLGIGAMKLDSSAPDTIKQLHVTHRSKMERQVAQGLEANYQRILKDLTQGIERWWEQVINKPKGLPYAMRFAEKLLAKLEWYQRMMEDESREEKDRLRTLSFKVVEEQLREAAGAFFGREGRVRTACQNYKGLVDRECELHVQVARRDKAAELYGALQTQVEEVLRRCARIRLNLEAALKEFERRFLDVSTSRSGESLFEHTLRFDVEGNRPKIMPDDFVKWYQEERDTLTAWASVRAEDVVRDIISFINQMYRPLTEMAIDDVLARSSPEEVARDLDQLDHLARPLWRYDEGKIPAKHQGVINELYHYGVADADHTVLKEPRILAQVPTGTSALSFVSTLDHERITLFKVKVGVPLFALSEIDDMERAYNDPDKVVSNHIHKDWHSFPNVIPRSGNGDALRCFAIAQAPAPFGLISRRGEWYYVRSQQARAVDGGELRLGQGRVNAFSSFEKNRDLIKEVDEEIDRARRVQGEAETVIVLRGYIDQLAKQASSGKVDASAKEQVEREIKAINDYIERMATIR